MSARADLLALADTLAAQAAKALDEGRTTEHVAELAAAAKVALEAAGLAENLPATVSDEHVQALELMYAAKQGYLSLRQRVLGLADQFANAGTPIATRRAEQIRQMVDEAEEIAAQALDPTLRQ